MTDESDYRRTIDSLLNIPYQVWLLGAGASHGAGIPLMRPLTACVEGFLKAPDKALFAAIRAELPENAHVEHVMSHIGDLIAIATRSKNQRVALGGIDRTVKELSSLHRNIQLAIQSTIRCGYVPAQGEQPARLGTLHQPLVTIEGHLAFLDALFNRRRAGLERRPPVAFFSTNYDTLLEDALALSRLSAADGFSGGAMAFWDPAQSHFEFHKPFSSAGNLQAKVYKLHGSIDWFVSQEDVVVRRRHGAGYPPDDTSTQLLIYPQATKYAATQKHPFSTLFAALRTALHHDEHAVLVVCGYSFSDEHICEEIERALKQRGNTLTVLAFVHQGNGTTAADPKLPPAIHRWLSEDSGQWKERLLVAGSHGCYHENLENRLPPKGDKPHTWWSFEGLTQLLKNGPEAV